MPRSRRATIIGLSLLCLSGLVACDGDAEKSQAQALTYRPGRALHVQVADGGREGSLRLEQITYRSADGQTVPGLFAIPTDRRPLGCIIYQGDLAQAKRDLPERRKGAAGLRLATLTIDPREGGARGSLAQATAALKKPETLRNMLQGTVVDLRMGLDYLERRSECHHNIAYLGTSFGAEVGALLAAQDRRIKATVLTSVGATYKAAILVGDLIAQKIPGFPAPVPEAATDPALLAHAVSILGPYDPAKWVGKIGPRPVMLINGRFDPAVLPVDALELADAARDPKTVLFFNGGHDPFAPGPDQQTVTKRVAEFLSSNLDLPRPL